MLKLDTVRRKLSPPPACLFYEIMLILQECKVVKSLGGDPQKTFSNSFFLCANKKARYFVPYLQNTIIKQQ